MEIDFVGEFVLQFTATLHPKMYPDGHRKRVKLIGAIMDKNDKVTALVETDGTIYNFDHIVHLRKIEND